WRLRDQLATAAERTRQRQSPLQGCLCAVAIADGPTHESERLQGHHAPAGESGRLRSAKALVQQFHRALLISSPPGEYPQDGENATASPQVVQFVEDAEAVLQIAERGVHRAHPLLERGRAQQRPR